MRRLLASVASVVLVAVLLAGCGVAGDLDRDLTDGWGSLGTAQPFTPRAGECHPDAEPLGHLSTYRPVDCALAHLVETFHVGTFTGEPAGRAVPPRVGSAQMRPAFTECDRRAGEFVGGDWRDSRLSVQVTPPSPRGWAGGSRWFRCDLFVLDEVAGPNGASDRAVQHSGTLRSVLSRDSPLRLTCFDEDEGSRLRPEPCAGPHRFEYVGTWTTSERQWTRAADDEEALHARCREMIAEYAGVPVDERLRYRTGSAFRLPSREAWSRGDRGVRCFYWSGGRPLSDSIRAGGTAVLPVN
ncbi:septum formation family protein [Micromonospora sp. SH-82]|uniref:septum formation family protein n=1 Tax=Micromonospora sp. SH-82 TaxID=3132938 RepID=UPI003EB93520